MLHRFKLQEMYFSDNQNFTEMANLQKTARAKSPDNLLLIHRLMILWLFENRHSQVSKTVFHIKIWTTGCLTFK